MPSPFVNQAIGQAAKRMPYLKKLPVLRLLVIGEIVLLANDHLHKLNQQERRRLVVLLRDGHGRPSNLSRRQRDELERLIAKAEPRLFAGVAAAKFSPVPLPGRVVRGPKRPKRP